VRAATTSRNAAITLARRPTGTPFSSAANRRVLASSISRAMRTPFRVRRIGRARPSAADGTDSTCPRSDIRATIRLAVLLSTPSCATSVVCGSCSPAASKHISACASDVGSGLPHGVWSPASKPNRRMNSCRSLRKSSTILGWCSPLVADATIDDPRQRVRSSRRILRRPVSSPLIAPPSCRGYPDAAVMLRRAIVGLAIVVMMTTTGLRFASASAHDSVAHCCCGDHSVSDECGCPDCPAGREAGGPEQTTLDRCYAEGSSPLTALLPVFDRHALTVALLRRPPILVSILVMQTAAPSRAITPPYKPPR